MFLKFGQQYMCHSYFVLLLAVIFLGGGGGGGEYGAPFVSKLLFLNAPSETAIFSKYRLKLLVKTVKPMYI